MKYFKSAWNNLCQEKSPPFLYMAKEKSEGLILDSVLFSHTLIHRHYRFCVTSNKPCLGPTMSTAHSCSARLLLPCSSSGLLQDSPNGYFPMVMPFNLIYHLHFACQVSATPAHFPMEKTGPMKRPSHACFPLVVQGSLIAPFIKILIPTFSSSMDSFIVFKALISIFNCPTYWLLTCLLPVFPSRNKVPKTLPCLVQGVASSATNSVTVVGWIK